MLTNQETKQPSKQPTNEQSGYSGIPHLRMDKLYNLLAYWTFINEHSY